MTLIIIINLVLKIYYANGDRKEYYKKNNEFKIFHLKNKIISVQKFDIKIYKK